MQPVGGKCVPGALKHDDGLCYCQPTTLTYCSTGCADLPTDPDHCGDCDTKCQDTQVCSSGKCGASPTVLVPAATGCGALHLALSAGTLYWSDQMHGTVQSIATAGGGAAKPVASTQMAPTIVVVNGTDVYWLATGAKSVMVSSAGAAAKVVATSATDAINGFTLSEDGKSLYYAAATKVYKTTAAPGGTPTMVGQEDTGIPHALAIAGNLLAYPTDVNGDIDIMTLMDGTPAVCASADSTTLTNKNCARLGRSQGSLNFDSIFLVNNVAYWANQASVLSNPDDGTGTNSTVATGDSNASKLPALSVSNATAYYADDLGFVFKASLDGKSKTGLARGQQNVTSIVADANNVYWAADCAIMSLPLK